MDPKASGDLEARATVRVLDDGSKDLTKISLVKQGYITLTDKQTEEILSRVRFRYSLIPKCNIWCVFCSNEGLAYSEKKHGTQASIDQIIALSEMFLANSRLRNIDLSGGEPTLHTDVARIINGQESKLINWTKRYCGTDVRFSLHSNGINLEKKLIDETKGHFSRFGVSVNAIDFDIWNRLTNFNNIYSIEAQKDKFAKMMRNLQYISEQGIGHKVFMKMVVMRGYNDSPEHFKKFLDTCEKWNFHPKFLEFEPQFQEQVSLKVDRAELFTKLRDLGATFDSDAPFHNNPDTYIPATNFRYGSAPLGLHSIFGCGTKGACETCYDFLCVFIKSNSKSDLYLKPCSVTDYRVNFKKAIENKDFELAFKLFKQSREYLMTLPGIGKTCWRGDCT